MRESLGSMKPKGAMKVKIGLSPTEGGWAASRCGPALPGRLVLRTKSGETLMEVRSDSDVQIVRRN